MVSKGSFVRVEYDAVTDDGILFDTTSADVARKHDAYSEKVVYEPLPIVVGAGRVLPGFDRALEEASVGEEREIVIPPSEAFGEKDPARFETHPLREFQKREVNPYPGMRVQMENRSGTVVSVTPGRV
ncbi:MAG TPA: FKBP-type peptidyl-prolyl cis-trans isomerase, partial [Candidatus Thermoplasmatota archaeon]|nr:FKBP-type peptidyl-prolyl cis-trans isomerase [Candidatus Thermoplasmatota archaeon]